MEKIRLSNDLTVTFPDNFSRKEIDKWLAWWYKNNNRLH